MSTRFPDPVKPPEHVEASRHERQNEILKASTLGVVVRSTIIVLELIGFFLFGSWSLFLDAMASLGDLASTAFLILCVRIAGKPPDKNHPFGHGRLEPLAGMQLGILLALVGVGLAIQQIFAFFQHEQTVSIDTRAWMIPVLCVGLLELCYRFATRIARKNHSPALAADALHYRVDALTSLLAALALGIGAAFPHLSGSVDHLGALAIALFMIIVGFRAARDNMNQVLDKTPSQHFFNLVEKSATKVEGVRGTEKIRIQMTGPDAHVDIDVEVDPDLAVDEAHRISQLVRTEIQKEWPAVRDVIVHIEPYYPGDH